MNKAQNYANLAILVGPRCRMLLKVLKFLYKHGDTFTDITPTLLNTDIEQSHIKYLLDELEHDKLIILSKANLTRSCSNQAFKKILS